MGAVGWAGLVGRRAGSGGGQGPLAEWGDGPGQESGLVGERAGSGGGLGLEAGQAGSGGGPGREAAQISACFTSGPVPQCIVPGREGGRLI